MPFDFGVLIVLILLVFFFMVGYFSKTGLLLIPTIPLALYLIVQFQEYEPLDPMTSYDPTLPTIAIAGFMIINVFLIYNLYFGGDK